MDDLKRQQRKNHPSVDRQQLDYIAAAIARSALDQQLQRIKVASGDSIGWIPFEDILNVDAGDKELSASLTVYG